MIRGDRSPIPAIISAAILLLISFTVVINLQDEMVDGSIAFQDDIRIDRDSSGSEQARPCVAVYENSVYVIWQDERNGNWDIYARASHNGGFSFGPEVHVDDTLRTATLADDISEQINPTVIVNNDGDVYVFWEDERLGKPMIHYSVSTDKGASFSSSMILSDSVIGEQRSPDSDISPSGDIHVAWRDSRDSSENYQIYSANMASGENGFTDPVKVSDASTRYDCKAPAISVPEDDRVHIVWNDDRVWDEDVYLSTSRNGGASFEPSLRISADPTGSDQADPEVVANEDKVYVIWTDPRTNSADIYYSVSTDDAVTFTPNMLMNPENNSGHQYGPRAALDAIGNMTVTWTSSPGLVDSKSDIQMTKLSWNGTLEEVYTVNDPILDTIQTQSDVAVNNKDGSFFVWQDNRNGLDKDIYFTRTTISGEEGFAPELYNVSVNPEIGGLGDKFTFKATYSDIENDAPLPGYPKVNLFYRSAANTLYPYPGSPFNMSRILYPIQDFNYYNGENYMMTLKINRELDLYYFISAKASSGNSTVVETDIMNLPVIDGSGPEFELLGPLKGNWIQNNIVPFSVKVTDELSGVEPWSIFYQKYQSETGGWGTWQRKGKSTEIDNKTLIYNVNVTFLEGNEGKIRFRAMDKIQYESDNPQYTLSSIYPVWVDPNGPVIDVISPRSGSILNRTNVTFTTFLKDDGSGLDTGSIEVAYSLTSATDLGPWMNLSEMEGSVQEDGEGYLCNFNISLGYGYSNYVMVRSKDVLGNIGTSPSVQIIILKDQDVDTGNKPPSRIENIQPKITGSVRPHITWSPSFDPEGGLVTYNLSVYDSTNEEYLVEMFQVTPGYTYWDPSPDQLFTAGHSYVIKIIPSSGEQKGPATESVLLVSTDANSPPEPVTNLTPRATSDRSPVISWDPSADPDGDEVYYFIRIGNFFGGGNILDWTSVLTNNRYVVGKTLSPGTYYVDVFSSDGKDFAPISHFTVSIGIYNPVLDVQRSQIVVYQGSGTTINLTIKNNGFTYDNIKIHVDGDIVDRSDIDILLGDDRIDIAPGSRVNTTFHVDAREDAKLGLYSLNVTLVSVDGLSTYTRGLSIRVVDPDNPDFEIGGSDVSNEEDDDTFVLLVLFIVLLIVIILAMGYAYYRIDSKERIQMVEEVERRRSGLSPKKKEGIGSGRKKKDRALPPKE